MRQLIEEIIQEAFVSRSLNTIQELHSIGNHKIHLI